MNARPADAHRPPRIAVIASFAPSLTRFRLDLLREMVARGCEVHALAPEADDAVAAELSGIGVRYEAVPMARAGLNPAGDLRTLRALRRALRRIGPDLVLPYTAKPIIYGLIAARLEGVPRRFALVTGLGYAFGDDGVSLRRWLVRRLSVLLYRIALRGVMRIFVYNEADERDVKTERLVPDPALVERVAGTGINLSRFPFTSPPVGPPVFLMIARLLTEKGVLDYVEAARVLRPRAPGARFQLLGPLDPNPSGIGRAQVERWRSAGVVEYLGETEDVRPHLAACSVFVLPTYYREGVPRTIQEALATGRAVVTTDVAGCRETIQPGVSGFVVPPRDPSALAEALERFIRDEGLAPRMSAAARSRAELIYDVDAVNRQLMTGLGLARPPAERALPPSCAAEA